MNRGGMVVASYLGMSPLAEKILLPLPTLRPCPNQNEYNMMMGYFESIRDGVDWKDFQKHALCLETTLNDSSPQRSDCFVRAVIYSPNKNDYITTVNGRDGLDFKVRLRTL
eukprot:4626087-Amphidinium_carterae.1